MSNEFEHRQTKKKLVGLKDGGKILFSCSTCGAPLINIWITRPDETQQIQIVVICAHCGDKSYQKTIKGGFHIGGTEFTAADQLEEQDYLLTIKTVKVKDYE